MKLYIESLKMHLKSTLEYKTSFIIGFFSQFLVYFTYYFIIIALFKSFVKDKVITNKECDSLIEYVKRTMILEEEII